MTDLPLLELATAFESLRESGFDFATAVGEPLDNAIEANATRIAISVVTTEIDGRDVIEEVAIVDNGDGMNAEVLQGCLQLGYSSRYNSRSGLGRFGVGATLAAISQCRRICAWSRRDDSHPWLYTEIDLEQIAANSQVGLPVPQESTPPAPFLNLMQDGTGTVIVWRNCDRLSADANGRPLDGQSAIDDLRSWISRAYRQYIWGGVLISINGQEVVAHDPLFLRPKETAFPNDPPSTIKFDHTINWPIPNSEDTSPVKILITLLPEELRQKRGAGGSPDAKARRIPENQNISVLRNDREVAFGNFYPMVPAQTEIDRWWGCEISFGAELDECWEVRNVKRGARPTKDLRDEIHTLIDKRIKALRKEIKEHWIKQDIDSEEDDGDHAVAEEIVREAEAERKPSVQAGKKLSDKEKKELRDRVVDDPDLPANEKSRLKDKVEGERKLPISIKSKALAGAEFMETSHIGDDQVVLTFNRNHPFFADVYARLEALEALEDQDIVADASTLRRAIDLLLMAYGRAESMVGLDNEVVDEAITELRTYWGVMLRKYLKKMGS